MVFLVKLRGKTTPPLSFYHWASHNNRIPIFILIIVGNRVTNSSPFAWNRSRVSETQRHTPIVNLRVYHPCYDTQKTEHWFGLKFHVIPGWRGEQYSGYISNTVLCKESVSHGWGYEESLRYLQVIPVIRNLSKHHCTPYHYLTTVVEYYILVCHGFLGFERDMWSKVSCRRNGLDQRGAGVNLKFPPQYALEYSNNILTITFSGVSLIPKYSMSFFSGEQLKL